MILGGKEIKRRYEEGDIFISDWDENRLNPNSYNLRLSDTLLVYDVEDGFDAYKRMKAHPTLYVELNEDKYPHLDCKKLPKTKEIKIPEEGLILYPGVLYLGRTVEKTVTHNLVPMLEGRSSIGRLGMGIHVTAGFGDVGFDGYWTLEITVVHPLKIYPNMEVCQIYYHEISGDYKEYNSGKYQFNEGIQPSLLSKDFEGKE